MIGHLLEAVVPSGFATALFLAGLVALLFRRTRPLAFPLVAGAATVLIIFSNGLVASLLSSPLEYSYPALRDPQQHPDAKFIAVLTAYAADDADMSAEREVERLRRVPGPRGCESPGGTTRLRRGRVGLPRPRRTSWLASCDRWAYQTRPSLLTAIRTTPQRARST